MKKKLLCFYLLFSGYSFCPLDMPADVILTNYGVISFQQPYNLSKLYCYELSRDNNGRLYCYYMDAQNNKRKVYLYNVRGKQNVYQITIDGVVYETFLDPQAMKTTEPK